MVVHLVDWGVTPLDEESPPGFFLTEVDGAVHGLHAFGGEPFTAGVEEEVGSLYAVYTLKKAHAACGLGFVEGCALIDEGGDTANGLALCVLEDPADTGAVFPELVFGRVEDGLDVFVQGTNPVGIVGVDLGGQGEEFLDQFFVFALDFEEFHGYCDKGCEGRGNHSERQDASSQ